jgi:hypothetical protein
VLAEVAVHEREQLALRVVDAGIRDHLLDEGWRHALGKLHRRRQPLQAGFLDVFRDRWQGVPAVLHGLERDQQNVDRHLKLQRVDRPSMLSLKSTGSR